MKKTFKRVLWGIGTLILIAGIVIFVFMLKFKTEVKLMTPLETGQLTENISSIRDEFVNIYLFKTGEQYVAIDAGNKLITVSDELKKLKISPDKIIAILLTHTDKDHVAAIKLFKKATIYLSRPEIQLINGDKSRFLIFGNKIDSKEYTGLEDQQIINIGTLKIQGILTPGHTIGSMCYLINDKYLFTGDVLSLKAGKIEKFNELFNMDTQTATQSIRKIANIPTAEYIFTAHYGFTDNYKKAAKDW